MATSTRVDRRTRAARSEGADARKQLLEAALEVFAMRGYRQASVDDIAERAGYSKGAVYWHFGSKDELFFSLLEERIEEPWRRSIELLETAGPDLDMSLEANRLFAQLVRDERDLMLVEREYWSLAVRNTMLRRRYAKRRAALRTDLGRAIAARLTTLGADAVQVDPERIAAMFIGLAQGLAQEKLTEPGAIPDDLLGESFVLIYLGLVAREGRR
jgi:AcrR family transcriptional regulator